MAAYTTVESTARQESYAASENEIRIAQGKKAEKAKVPYIKYGIIALCLFSVLAVMIFFNMQNAELASKNSVLKKEIVRLSDEENALNAKKEQMYNLSSVEDYAKNVLGMVKMNRADINYVELANEERISIAQPEENSSEVVSGITRAFNIVLEYLN